MAAIRRIMVARRGLFHGRLPVNRKKVAFVQNMKKLSVAIFPGCYLAISMTFVYEQLKAISDFFEPIVLASRVDNLDIFPFDPVYVKGVGWLERHYCTLYKKLYSKAFVLSRSQKRIWKDALKKHDVKLIHAHFGPAGLTILPLAKALGIPLITTFHGYDASRCLMDPMYVSNLRELFDYAQIITVSKTMADKLVAIGMNGSRIEVIYCGIPIDEFPYVKRVALRERAARGHRIRFLQVSNFVEKKGHKYTVMAFKQFLSHYPNAQLTFGGDGSWRREIERLCNSLGIEEKVRFLGKVSRKEVIPLMRQADVFLHHSVTAEDGDQEGIPTSIMEAMATGLIVISTYHSGICELIDDGVTGILVKEKDVESYANKMVKAISYGSGLGRRAREKVKEQFNMDLQKVNLYTLYRRIIYGRNV